MSNLLHCVGAQTRDGGMVALADLIDSGLAWHETRVRKDAQLIELMGPATALSLRVVEFATSDESDPVDMGDAVALIRLDGSRSGNTADAFLPARLVEEPLGVYSIRDGQTLQRPFNRAAVRVELSTRLAAAVATESAAVIIGWGICVASGDVSRRPELVEPRVIAPAVGSTSTRTVVPDAAGGVSLLSSSTVRVGWVVQNVGPNPIALQWDNAPGSVGAASIELAVGSAPLCSGSCLPVSSELYAIGNGGLSEAAVTEAVR